MANEDKSIFETLYALDTSAKHHKKSAASGYGSDELTYLPWASAWAEVNKLYPTAEITIWRHPETYLPYICDPNTGYMVFVSVTLNGITRMAWLPVMDSTNRAMKSEPYTYKVKNKKFKNAKFHEESGLYLDSYGEPQEEFIDKMVEAATMNDINKALMRCLAKACAMHGLALYIYEKEEFPEAVTKTLDLQDEVAALAKKKSQLSDKAKEEAITLCKEADREANPDVDEEFITGKISNINDPEILENLKRKLMKIRK